MKRIFVVLCACCFCLSGCAAKQKPSAPEGFFQPEIHESAPMPQVIVPIEKETDTAGASTDEITCVVPVAPTDPAAMSGAPDLTVFCSGKEVPAMFGGLTWVTDMPDGTKAVLCADALHPLEMQKYLTVLETVQNTAGLCFWDGDTQVWPGEIHIEAWNFTCTPDCDGLPTEVAVYSGGEMIELLPGKNIYIVHTRWGDGETSGGSVTHVFCADKLYPGNE